MNLRLFWKKNHQKSKKFQSLQIFASKKLKPLSRRTKDWLVNWLKNKKETKNSVKNMKN